MLYSRCRILYVSLLFAGMLVFWLLPSLTQAETTVSVGVAFPTPVAVVPRPPSSPPSTGPLSSGISNAAEVYTAGEQLRSCIKVVPAVCAANEIVTMHTFRKFLVSQIRLQTRLLAEYQAQVDTLRPQWQKALKENPNSPLAKQLGDNFVVAYGKKETAGRILACRKAQLAAVDAYLTRCGWPAPRNDASCGDGITSEPEVCDDGNSDNNDACTNTCTENFCGDGIVQSGIEQCDDGNADDDDGCPNTCSIAVCGDGVVTSGQEECDDSNTSDGDGCSAQCTLESCYSDIDNPSISSSDVVCDNRADNYDTSGDGSTDESPNIDTSQEPEPASASAEDDNATETAPDNEPPQETSAEADTSSNGFDETYWFDDTRWMFHNREYFPWVYYPFESE